MNRQDANMESENIQYWKLITKHTSNIPSETYFLPSIFFICSKPWDSGSNHFFANARDKYQHAFWSRSTF